MDSVTSVGASLLRWHLVFTKPSGEHVAKTNLERQGYRVYFPRLQQRILRRGAWRETISALFPRYLFVQLDAAIQSLSPLRSTHGVTSVVRFGTEYVSVPGTIVDGLMDREDDAGLHCLSFKPLFECGTAIRVIEGALAGIEGIFEREDANDRVVVLLNLLGRETLINLPAASVMPAGSSY